MPSVAILGASANRTKFGNKAVRAFQRAGWRVHPINPRGAPIESINSVASVGDLPERVDLLSVYLPPAVTLTLVDDLADAQPRSIWLNPGAESPELVMDLERVALPFVQQCSITALGFSPADFPG